MKNAINWASKISPIGGCNCPSCISGIMEPLGFMKITNGPAEFCFGSKAPENQPALNISICSKEICGYVHIEGTPGTLRFINNLRR